MTETVTCCQRNGFADKAEQCKCGRLCPEGRVDLSAILTRRVSAEGMTRRTQEAEARWAIGVEAADAARVTGAVPPIVTTELREVSEPFDWAALVIWIGVGVAFGAIAALSIADPRDLSTLWPRLVALASF